MKTFQYLAVGATLLTIFGCGSNVNEVPVEEISIIREEHGMLIAAAQIKASGIETQPLEEKTTRQVIKASGKLDVPTQYMASVTTFVGSFVKTANKHVGEQVKKGQVLAIMEGPEFIDLQQQYLEHKTQLALLKSEFDRQANLSADSVTSRKNYEIAKAEYERTVAMVTSLREKLSYTNVDFAKLENGQISNSFAVLAPISGYLEAVNARIGAFVSPGESLMEIVDLSHMHVELAVYETNAMEVKEGQRMRIWLPSNPGVSYDAEIYLIDKTFDPENRTIMAHGHFEEEDHSFIVGMYVEGEIELGGSIGLSVPATAAVYADQQRFVFLTKDSGNEGTWITAVELSENTEAGSLIQLPAGSVPKGYTNVVTKGAGYLLGEWFREE